MRVKAGTECPNRNVTLRPELIQSLRAGSLVSFGKGTKCRSRLRSVIRRSFLYSYRENRKRNSVLRSSNSPLFLSYVDSTGAQMPPYH